jgi:hypothetical protein
MSILGPRSHALLSSALTLALVGTACGGDDTSASSSGASTSGGEAMDRQGPQGHSVRVDFEGEIFSAPDAEVARMHISIVLTDETGATMRVQLGDFMGCDEPGATDTTLFTLTCFWAGTGDSLHVVREGDDLVILKEDLAEELIDAERVPVQRFHLAPGAEVTFGE